MKYRAAGLLLASMPTALSIVLLSWNIRSVGLSHWDEYNYLTTAKWFLGINGAVFTIYEPPAFSFFVAVFFKLFGVFDYVAIAVSATFAIMTVALVAYLGAKMFNLEAGFVASLFLTVIPLFLIYSRMALTDVAFTFFFTASVAAIYSALTHRNFKLSLLAGFILAFCFMTKYNGFMALVIPAFFLPIELWNVNKGERARMLAYYVRHFFIIITPSLLAGILFIDFLGLGGGLKSLFGRNVLGLLSLGNFGRGVSRFQAAAVQPHAGQLSFLPLISSYFFLQVLLTWVPVPILLLVVIGLFRRKLKNGNELFVSFWFIMTFILISSQPSHYSRAILPCLPPLSLAAALGVIRVKTELAALRFSGKLVRLFAHRQAVSALIVVLVIGMSSTAAIQAVSATHASYREVGRLLANMTGTSASLAETQPILAFYHQVEFGKLSDQRLNNVTYLVVDFVGVNNGYQPTIARLESEGRIKLVTEVASDVPSVVYLDWTGFDQLRQWDNATIRIYRVLNTTSTQTAT